MKISRTINIIILLSLSIFMMGGCRPGTAKKLNERVSIWRKDKIPYGTFYAFEQLPYIFPNAEIIVDKESPDKHNAFQKVDYALNLKLSQHKGRNLQFIISPEVSPTKEEWKAMLDFVWEGNQLFISSFYFDQTILDSLKLKVGFQSGYFSSGDSLQVSVLNPLSQQETTFAYPGFSFDNYFLSMDSSFTNILGYEKNGKANFVKISYESGGAIYLHLAPLAFSNFFLLHKDNKAYYDYALSNIHPGMEIVTWVDYFRTHSNGNSSNYGKAFEWLMNQPPFAWALWITLAMFLIVYLFESKRRQRIIPIKTPVRNASLDFVKTVGRLYLQRKDNKNMSMKMQAHFLDHVRTRYNIPTSRLDGEFEKRLAHKTGQPLSDIQQLIYQMKYLADQPAVSDEALMDLSNQLESFYKKV